MYAISGSQEVDQSHPRRGTAVVCSPPHFTNPQVPHPSSTFANQGPPLGLLNGVRMGGIADLSLLLPFALMSSPKGSAVDLAIFFLRFQPKNRMSSPLRP